MGNNDLRLAHLVAMTAERAAVLRRDPAALASLREGPREETGLGQYGHAIQFLLAGRAEGVRGPLAWLTGGGEELGRNAGGPVRYLSPAQVQALSTTLADTEPDELGDDTFDEAAMDEAGVYPGGWVRSSETFDALGTLRELYSYLRSFLARQSQAGKGVAIVMTLEPASEPDASGRAEVPPSSGATPPAPPASVRATLLTGANGRRYERADASPQPALDETLAGLGYRPLGDLAILPVLAGSVVRSYRADDGKAVAAVVLNKDRIASTTFLARLAKDAVVVVSDAFVQEKAKRRVFATMLTGAQPAELEAKLRERCLELEKKHGAPLVLPPEVGSAAEAWEAWWAKQAGAR